MSIRERFEMVLELNNDDYECIKDKKDCGCIHYMIDRFCPSVVDYINEMDDWEVCKFHENELKKKTLNRAKKSLGKAEDDLEILKNFIAEQKMTIERVEKKIAEFEKK